MCKIVKWLTKNQKFQFYTEREREREIIRKIKTRRASLFDYEGISLEHFIFSNRVGPSVLTDCTMEDSWNFEMQNRSTCATEYEPCCTNLLYNFFCFTLYFINKNLLCVHLTD